MFRSLTLALSVPWMLVGQQILRNPIHFWTQESEYAGSAACNECHAEIYRRQSASHHALSLRPASETPQFGSGAEVRQNDPISGSTLLISREGGRRPSITATKGADKSALELEWAFGSGVKGVTPVGRRAGGEFLEGRLTWYASVGGFDFTPGDAKYTPVTTAESLGRVRTIPDIGECFGCHTTAYDKENPAPVGKDIGIRCERCHGPGQEHIRAARRGAGGRQNIPTRQDGRFPAASDVRRVPRGPTAGQRPGRDPIHRIYSRDRALSQPETRAEPVLQRELRQVEMHELSRSAR